MSAKNIILGVSGGIAAYKTPELVRRLRDRGAKVQVVMTRSANEFVTETSLQAVSGLPVRQNLWDKDAEAAMGHIELARWADEVVIAPATAEIIARLAAGSAPDLLTTLCLATNAPIVLAPAMNHVMWGNSAVQENVDKLVARGVRILGPDEGDQACGETGPGRMMQPDAIAAAVMVSSLVSASEGSPLAGKTVMVTAGPTREAMDPVRFISNRSSGKMGYALAVAARRAGANVILISGPVILEVPTDVRLVSVESAGDMLAATHENIEDVDIFIATAAVSDYHPVEIKDNKIKKDAGNLSLELTRSADILASVASLNDGPFTVGFAAETEKLREHAMAKLKQKNLNMIVANLVGGDLAFGKDQNAVEVYWRNGEQSFPMTSKTSLAQELVTLIVARYEEDSNKIAALHAVANSD